MNIKIFIIYNPFDEKSILMSNDCAKSAQKYDYKVEKIKGIYSNRIELLKKYNIKLPPETELCDYFLLNNKQRMVMGSKYKLPRLGVFGCFLSHFILWKKCVEENINFMIFEHDAEFIQNIPKNILQNIDDFLHLDLNRHILDDLDLNNNKIDIYEMQLETEKYKPVEIKKLQNCEKFKQFPQIGSTLSGAHAYVITPTGAKKIINWVENNYILPADILTNSNIIKIQYTNISCARIQKNIISKIHINSNTIFDEENLHYKKETIEFLEHFYGLKIQDNKIDRILKNWK